MTAPETMKCAVHRDTETNLRCGKCGKPICPRCLVQTPVGARCRECSKLYTLPTYRISASYYLRAAGAALGTAIVIGTIWGIIYSYLGPYGMFVGLLILYASGYAIAELTGLAANRKRGVWLALIAGLAVVICGGISHAVRIAYMANVRNLGVITYNTLEIIFAIIAVGYGVLVAVRRLR